MTSFDTALVGQDSRRKHSTTEASPWTFNLAPEPATKRKGALRLDTIYLHLAGRNIFMLLDLVDFRK